MKKSVLCLLLSILLLPVFGTAESKDPTGFDLKSLAEDAVFLATLDDPTHAVLGLELNADARRYPASTTKIMTAILALERSDPDELVTASKRACNLSEHNSKMGLKTGETYSMTDMLYGLMLPSGNDAAIAIAEHIGGSIEGFAELMNAKAEELGMTDTHFTNPSGLHDDAHYTTARDLAILTAYAYENETFAKIVSTVKYTATSTEGRKLRLYNSNRLLRDATATTYTPYSCLYADAIGVKTGDTANAGKCLVAAARRNNTTYLLVLLNGTNAPSGVTGLEKDIYSAQRFYDAIELFNYVFANDTVTVDVDDLIDRCLPETYAITPDPSVSLASEALYRIEWDPAASETMLRWQAGAFLSDPFPEEYLTYRIDSPNAPIGTKAGTVVVSMSGRTVFWGDLIAEDYTYPPTPEPSAVPVYPVMEETPSPVTPELPDAPSSPDLTPIGTPQPERPWYWFLFRCSGDG